MGNGPDPQPQQIQAPGPLPGAASRGLNGEPGWGDTQDAAVLPLRAFCCVGCPAVDPATCGLGLG